ncbi:hypothetical protein [Rubrivirga sp.]|uniref:hypothetical protein n=1 Tax=Rubrivirga sp. TaxID=1885344 RepID=UPI003C726B8B
MPSALIPRLVLAFAASAALVMAFVVGVALEIPFGGAILVGMAALAGVGSWWVGRRGAQNDVLTTEFDAQRHAEPDAPWTWRDDWSAGRYASRSDRTGAVLAWTAIALSVAYVAVAVSAIVAFDGELDVQWLTPLIGMALLYKPVKKHLLTRRAGPTTVVLEDVPARLGECLVGVARIGLDVVPPDGVRVRLACIERSVTRSRNGEIGKAQSKSVSEKVRWETTQSAQARTERAEAPATGAQQVVVPFAFDLPSVDAPGAEPTSMMPAWKEENAPSRVLWRIEVVADVGGAPFESSVELAVFEPALGLEVEPASSRPVVAGVSGA